MTAWGVYSYHKKKTVASAEATEVPVIKDAQAQPVVVAQSAEEPHIPVATNNGLPSDTSLAQQDREEKSSESEGDSEAGKPCGDMPSPAIKPAICEELGVTDTLSQRPKRKRRRGRMAVKSVVQQQAAVSGLLASHVSSAAPTGPAQEEPGPLTLMPNIATQPSSLQPQPASGVSAKKAFVSGVFFAGLAGVLLRAMARKL
jgi:hypothetical protein